MKHENVESFVAAVMDRIEFLVTLDDETEEIFQREAEEFFERGFSEDDAVEWMKCTEEVSPHLDEETALKRMHKIQSKYGGFSCR